MVRIVVLGAAGRMGRAIAGAAMDAAGVDLVGGVDGPGEARQDLGERAGRGPIGVVSRERLDDLPADVLTAESVLVDFTTAAAAADHAEAAAVRGTPIVIGATGFEASHEARIAEAARRVAIVKSGNMSLGVNLIVALARRAAAALGPEFDVEIVEAHHRWKADAPSGTALMLGRAVAEARGGPLDDVAAYGRHGASATRGEDEIGFAAVRGGGVVGDHEALFLGVDEAVSIGHRAFDRRLFANGALRAARWLAERNLAGGGPGLFDMTDVLGLD
ncbi:MAG: 4-hydroxy-tetrahydrodipicolinate reductase [Parvularculaceae bacterium]